METAIPKIIHYCWFGGNEKPARVKKCIESWKKYCPEFTIKEWNESNYDIYSHPFMKKAAEAEKWAFVSDYARLDILYNYGGIYLDTDVEVIKNLSPICENQAFIGFQTVDEVNDGQGFGGIKGFELFKEMLSVYDNLDEFIESPKLRTKVLVQYGLKLNGQMQNVCGMQIFPSEYLNPKNYNTGKVTITDNTYSIHYYTATWKGKNSFKYTFIMRTLCKIWGVEKGMNKFSRFIEFKDFIKDKFRG